MLKYTYTKLFTHRATFVLDVELFNVEWGPIDDDATLCQYASYLTIEATVRQCQSS